MDILTALDAIVDAAKDSKLSDEFYKKSAKYINPHCGLVRINKLVFSVCFFGRYFWGPHKFYRT